MKFRFNIYTLTAAVLALSACSLFGGPSSSANEALSVAEAGPHSLLLNTKGERFTVTLHIKDDPDGMQVVDQLEVQWADGRKQALAVQTMTPVPKGDDFFLATVDLNSDGFRDLYFATRRGAGANLYSDYWTFNPANHLFTYLGNFPLLQVDPSTRQISSRESGGSAGMLYTENQYTFQSGHFVLVEIEQQTATAKANVFLKQIYNVKDGKKILVKSGEVSAPAQR